MQYNCDFHIHSRFSGGVSDKMRLNVLAVESKKKGVHLIGTGDCLHPKWFSEILEMNKIDEGTFECNGARFILTTELEDAKRVHHLILFPCKSSVDSFIEKIKGKHSPLDSDGRQKVHMFGAELAEIAKDVDALIGPAHAFTPWTGLYGSYNSIKECYEDMTKNISFIELGLSADSSYADRIEELRRYTYFTNSDAHSPYPSKLAREFNRLELKELTYSEVKKAILREGGRKFVLNVGMPPEEGKYNRTACIKCPSQYSLSEAVNLKWKCKCGGRLKKGVRERVDELATYKEPQPPEYRPRYLHIIPLSEIIGKAFESAPTTRSVISEWEKLISSFESEVSILVDEPIEKINSVADERVSWAIECFREGKIVLHPGGGGRFGTIEIPSKKDSLNCKENNTNKENIEDAIKDKIENIKDTIKKNRIDNKKGNEEKAIENTKKIIDEKRKEKVQAKLFDF